MRAPDVIYDPTYPPDVPPALTFTEWRRRNCEQHHRRRRRRLRARVRDVARRRAHDCGT